MPDAVIVAAARTAIGTARKGTLLDVSAFDLAKYAVGEALKRSGVPAPEVDDLALGESLQGGGDIARYAAVELGLVEIPGVALNRHCASGMASVQGAAASIMAGMDKVVIAGGSESISTSPQTMKRTPGTDDYAQWMSPSHPATPDAPAFDMSITVGYNTAQSAGLTREDCDA
ncbi:MAG: acetyl-CoA C-acyltransferase, partial [Actinomycetota bacterium]|nr:acetyl-CoA C-acyltransferase [Actinomycetota bacterium]